MNASPSPRDTEPHTPAEQAVLPEWIQGFAPFRELPGPALAALAAVAGLRRFAVGETLMRDSATPEGILLVLQGQVRAITPVPGGTRTRTLERLGPGSVLGWSSLVSGRPRETLRAMEPVTAILLPSAAFLTLLDRQPGVAHWFHRQLPLAELHQLLAELVRERPAYAPFLENWMERELGLELYSGRGDEAAPAALNPARLWVISSGGPLGREWTAAEAAAPRGDAGSLPWLRLVGLPHPPAPDPAPAAASLALPAAPPPPERGAAPAPAPEPLPPLDPELAGRGPLSLRRASGPRQVPLAIAQALARHFQVPLQRDNLLDAIDALLRRQPRLNRLNMGQLLDSLGLRLVLTRVPIDRLHRLPTPAVLEQHGQLVLLEGVDGQGRARILEPELGPLRIPPQDLDCQEGRLEVLIPSRRLNSPEDRFGWGWFLPFLRPHRRQLIEVLAASFVVNLLALVTPLGLQVLIDQVARYQNMGALISISALLLLAGIATAVVRTLRTYVFAQLTNRIDQDGKATILDHLVRLPQDFFDSRPVGQITFYFQMLDRLREFLVGQSLTTIVDFGFAILYCFILLAFSPLLTLVTLSTLPLMIILALVSGPIYEGQIKRSLTEAMRTYSYLNEAITGIQTIKSQNAELKTRWEFQHRYARFIGEDFKLKLTSESVNNIASFINDLNALLVIGFGIWLVMKNQLTLGGFIAFRIIAGSITRPLVQVVQTWQQFRVTSQQIRMVGDVVNRVTEQSEREASNIPMPPIRGEVRLEKVSFRFREQGPLVLHNISLSIPEGSFVGMVGGSGSGKSTVLKLLPRFYRPEQGRVLIDGLDVSKVELYSLRRQIGVVPQDSLLFDGTIRDNLLLVKPDATVEEMIQAARTACAHDFIMEMPLGYNSSVGERGAGLSGGQRQRLAIARAVLQNPRLLVFDEATSALDARTERELCRNLFEAFRGRTVFFITHRLGTVRHADRIVLMDRGVVMETGGHEELMAKRGWYYALYQSQNRSGEDLS